MSKSEKKKTIIDAGKVIDKFGGIRPMANKMNIPATTVQGWKKRNTIPLSREKAVKDIARAHNIDLSECIRTANNTDTRESTAAPSPSFSEEVKKASSSQEPSAPHAEQPSSYKASSASSTSSLSNSISNEALMDKINAAERRAVRKSGLISTFLVLLTIGAGAVLLWPTQQQTSKNATRLTKLEGDVKALQEDRGSVLENLIPTRFKKDFSKLKEDAQGLQQQFSVLAEKAESLNQNVLAPDAGTLNQRLDRLEEIVGDVSQSSEISALIEKVKTLQQSVAGQEQLSETVSELNTVLMQMQGQVDTLDERLQSAQQGEGAIGETFKNVSGDDLKAAAMLVGLAQFRSALNRNNAFSEDLELMKQMVGTENPELLGAIERLAPSAENGVLTPEGLSAELRGLTGDIVVSSLKGENTTLKEQAQARLNNVLQVEKDGIPVTGTETQKTIARAQKALDDGDIQGAITALQNLEGEAGVKAQPLIEDAETTLLARQVESMLTDMVFKQISQSPSIGSLSASTPSAQKFKAIMRELEQLGTGHGRVIEDESSGMQIYLP